MTYYIAYSDLSPGKLYVLCVDYPLELRNKTRAFQRCVVESCVPCDFAVGGTDFAMKSWVDSNMTEPIFKRC